MLETVSCTTSVSWNRRGVKKPVILPLLVPEFENGLELTTIPIYPAPQTPKRRSGFVYPEPLTVNEGPETSDPEP